MDRVFKILFLTSFFLFCSCDRIRTQELKIGDDWLASGSADERFAQVSKHLRGFDMAMVETGYRYIELYWAGEDGNWEYADYQLEKLRTAISNGLERRPKRASSAQMIFPELDKVVASIGEKDLIKYRQSFTTLTQSCNACHAAEKVSFFNVSPPSFRVSPIFKSAHLVKEQQSRDKK